MEFLNSWLQGIIISVVVATIIEMILPNGNAKKYVKIVLGIYVVFNIITPIINQFTNSNFELSSIINIEEYTEKMDTYEVSSKNIDELNEKNIEQLYITNLKNDITAKLEEKDYLAKSIEVEIENDKTYEIKSINLILEKKEKEEQSISHENKVIINEIEEVKIQVSKEEQKTKEEKNITEKEINEIKSYLSSIYEIKEKQIIIN